MPKRQTLNIGGLSLQADEMDFKVLEEAWGTYELEDGTKIKVRMVVSRIFKLPDPDPQIGGPAYYIVGTTVNKPE